MLASAGDKGLDINDPNLFRDYYKQLYDMNDPASASAELTKAIEELDFPKIAQLYRLIDQDAIQILVPWADRWDDFQTLRTEAEQTGISAGWMRRAQGLAVSVYRPRDGFPDWMIPAKLRRRGTSDSGDSDDWFILEGDHYDDTLGLKPPEGPQVFIA